MGRVIKGTALLLQLLIVVCFLGSCSDGPTGITQDYGQGEIDPTGGRDFFLGSATVDGILDGRCDVWAYNLTVTSDSSGNVVAFDVVLVNRSGTTIYPPVVFWITRIIPSDVTVLNSDIVYIRQGPPGFDFSDDLGPDGKLEPGERSAPVNMQFGMTELTSFSIGFDISAGSPPSDADISGVVFVDRDQDGGRDDTEPGIPGVQVVLNPRFPVDVATPIVGVTETDREGHYGFAGLYPGVYEIQAFGPGSPTTPNPMLVTLIGDSMGARPIDGVDFGFSLQDSTYGEPVFGPVSVGPGSENGTSFEGLFQLHGPPEDAYVLDVSLPPILSPIAVLMRVDAATVWLNSELIYGFVCDDSAGAVCLPGARLAIPPYLLRADANYIRISVEGTERAFLMFSVLQASDLPEN